MDARTQPVVQDDAALVARLAVRDPQAMREAVDRFGPRLHRIAARVTGDATEAEDIAQEALLRLWDNADRWQAGGVNLSAMLTRVTVNLSIDRQRRRRRIVAGEVPDRADEAPLAEEAMVEDQEAGRARALIAALPPAQRAAIVLTYYEELPNVAAAEALDMKLKAFESLLFRARAALRAAYLQQEGGL